LKKGIAAPHASTASADWAPPKRHAHSEQAARNSASVALRPIFSTSTAAAK